MHAWICSLCLRPKVQRLCFRVTTHRLQLHLQVSSFPYTIWLWNTTIFKLINCLKITRFEHDVLQNNWSRHTCVRLMTSSPLFKPQSTMTCLHVWKVIWSSPSQVYISARGLKPDLLRKPQRWTRILDKAWASLNHTVKTRRNKKNIGNSTCLTVRNRGL